MPFDATTRDDLSDINKTKPLSIPHIKRIVRAARAHGLLAMDHVSKLVEIVPPDVCPYLSPHGAVDAFLGTENRSSCPCRLQSQAHKFLERINNLHREILFWRVINNDNPR